MGRFINADALTTTGQGLLGNNMFTYCNNNPIMLVDSSGKSPMYFGEDYPGYLGRQVAEWIQELINTDENETDSYGNLTINAHTKKMAKLIYNNIEISGGIGFGIERETTVLDIIGLGAGMHANVLQLQLENGSFSYGSEYTAGAAASMFYHNIGYVENAYNLFYKPGELEISKGFYGDETLTIYSLSWYSGVGGNFRIGFDMVQFIYDFREAY